MLTPLAVAELDRLFADILSGDLDGIRTWCTRNSAKARKRERHVLLGLTAAAVARDYDRRGPEAPFAAVYPDANREPWELMCDRLGVAALNDDINTVDALVEAWALWPAEEREKILAGLAWKLNEEWGMLRARAHPLRLDVPKRSRRLGNSQDLRLWLLHGRNH